MSYLIDTCCISELVKKNPDPRVKDWFTRHDESDMFLSVLTIGELMKGINKLNDMPKKENLLNWVNNDLKFRFRNRIMDISIPEVKQWGEILARCESKGTPLPAIDALIAATAMVHDLSVVTRNVGDMRPAGVRVINPWSSQAT